MRTSRTGSKVFLTKHNAYKLKKPVRLDFMDYRTIEARRRFCEAGVTLNQRLVPGVYLGTVSLALAEDDHLGLHGDGVVVDWLVQMQKLPLERRLDAHIAARAGSVIDAHGDLRPEYVYLLDPPVILDRLEFDRDLRLLDPVDELAFFVIECERLGTDWIGDFAFDFYQERNCDELPSALIASYESLRACMRVRLALGHLVEPAAERNSPWFRLAEHYAAMALDYAADITL